MKIIESAGLLNYRIVNDQLEFLLCKTGGPYWTNIERSWNIPKGHVESEENHLSAAIREFIEETILELPIRPNFRDIGCAIASSGKQVYIYSFEYDYGDDVHIQSNIVNIEWPRHSGIYIDIPELAEGKYFNLADARKYMYNYQLPLIDILIKQLEELKNE